MNKIIKAEDLPEGDKVYLKKDKAGWRVVEPIKDDQGKFLWKRILLGTKRERRFLYFIIFLALVTYLAYQEQLTNYYEVVNNPCAYCNSCQDQTRKVIEGIKIDQVRFSPELNITFPD